MITRKFIQEAFEGDNLPTAEIDDFCDGLFVDDEIDDITPSEFVRRMYRVWLAAMEAGIEI